MKQLIVVPSQAPARVSGSQVLAVPVAATRPQGRRRRSHKKHLEGSLIHELSRFAPVTSTFTTKYAATNGTWVTVGSENGKTDADAGKIAAFFSNIKLAKVMYLKITTTVLFTEAVGSIMIAMGNRRDTTWRHEHHVENGPMHSTIWALAGQSGMEVREAMVGDLTRHVKGKSTSDIKSESSKMSLWNNRVAGKLEITLTAYVKPMGTRLWSTDRLGNAED